MGVDNDPNFSCGQQGGSSPNCRLSPMFSVQQSEKAAGTATSFISMRKEVPSSMTTPCSSANVAEQFLAADWNPLDSVDQDVDFNGSSGLSSYNVRVPQSQGSISANTLVEQFPRPSTFYNESIPETMNSFDLSKSGQIASALCPPDFHFASKHGIDKSPKGKKRKSMSECGTLQPHSPLDRVQNGEAEQQKNVSPESVRSPAEKNEKNQKSESPGGITPKTTVKHAKEHSQDGDSPQEDYIHVRAKRGQATNSHSLAERLRREKISERMRLLQDLVPGCNKITGKAMMLDEIINYVQSLQRQVEFLSMKLAAVNPELHFDIEQILSKDIFHSRDGSSAVLGFGPGMNTSHPHLLGSSPHGIMQSEMVMCSSAEMMRATIPQVSSMAQISSAWDDELQNVFQMGFIPNPPFVVSDPNGSMKMEQ